MADAKGVIDAELERALKGHDLRSVFQPIVDLYSGSVVGYEALVRGPEGTLETPAALFAAATAAGRLGEFDRHCRRAAVRGAIASGLGSPLTLFVNVDPLTLQQRGCQALQDLADIDPGLRIVVEITERALTARPADLLPAVQRLRARGLGIALDDVGADPRSLALMPFLRPDVIKLDLSLVQARPSAATAEAHNAVSAQAEATGATVLAEGIETPAHAERARTMGATLGQGYLLGRPAPAPRPPPKPSVPVSFGGPVGWRTHETPYETVSEGRRLRRGSKRLLLAISRELEVQAGKLGPSGVIISTFQDATHFTPPTRRRYGELANHAAFVGAIGEGLGTEPAPGVRGADLDPDEPLAEEWDIAVIGPHYAASFAARDLGDTGPDSERRFDFALTHDRHLAVSAARLLMEKIQPLERPARELEMANALA